MYPENNTIITAKVVAVSSLLESPSALDLHLDKHR